MHLQYTTISFNTLANTQACYVSEFNRDLIFLSDLFCFRPNNSIYEQFRNGDNSHKIGSFRSDVSMYAQDNYHYVMNDRTENKKFRKMNPIRLHSLSYINFIFFYTSIVFLYNGSDSCCGE